MVLEVICKDMGGVRGRYGGVISGHKVGLGVIGGYGLFWGRFGGI